MNVEFLIKIIREFTKYEIYMKDTSYTRRIEVKQNTRPDDPIDLDSISRKYKGVIKQNNELLIKKTSL